MALTNGVPPDHPQDPNPDQQDPGEPFSHLLQILRGSVRPLVTLILVGALTTAFMYVVLIRDLSIEVLTGIVVSLTSMATTVVGVWFGQRR